MRESEIEKILVEEVRSAGGIAYKFSSPGNDGVPDRLIVLPGGRVIFVELKTKRGKLTKLQKMQLNRLWNRGAVAYCVHGLSGLRDLFGICGMGSAAARVDKLLERGEI